MDFDFTPAKKAFRQELRNGSARPRVDLPRLVDLYSNKQLKLDEFVSRTYPLEDINQSMTALEKGEVARSVIVM